MIKKITSLSVTILMAFTLTAQMTVIPKPNKFINTDEQFHMNSETVIFASSNKSYNATYLREFISKATGYDFIITKNMPENNYIILDLSKKHDIPQEGYQISVKKEGVMIKGSDAAGIFYGIQTLFQMLPPVIYSGQPKGTENWTLEGIEIEDSPRFEYRGMHLDVSRTFFDAETVKRYIDWMSHHKINKFHWHLTDDNGWRIEIKKYPKLTELGAWRGENEVLEPAFGSGNERYGGYYTQKQIKEIVSYAAQRHIDIIPEIDLPGHSKAVTASYPKVACDGDEETKSVQGETKNVWCVGKEENFKMLDNIIKEVSALFPYEYFHIGGDEVNYDAWDNCPHCQALMEKEGMKDHKELLNYFVRRMESIVNKHGKKMAGWDEILYGGDIMSTSMVYAWRSIDKGIESVKRGQPTVMMPAQYCYFDMKYTPQERGHNWAGIVSTEKTYSLDPVKTASLNEKESSLVVGVQGGLWAELLGRPARFMEYQTYPRLAALAEVGWTQPQFKEWTDFSYRLSTAHFERMYQMGIAFRLDPPKAIYSNGAIMVTAPYPWAVVRYTSDESEPTMLSPIYRGEIITDKAHKFRFATFYKDEIKSISIQPENANYTYLTPKTTVETSMSENERFPSTNVLDYKYETYFRTDSKIKAGDHFTYIFDKPVKASRITVETGIPKITFYGVTDGYAEYSYDGVNYTGKTYFRLNTAVLYPEKPVIKVRIVATKPNDGYILSLQDLKIEE